MNQPRRHHRALLIVLLVIVVFVGSGLTFVYFMSRNPLAGECKHDFGIITLIDGRGMKEHVFHLTNRGKETVVIEKVKSSCGCTAVDLASAVIPPGNSIDIPVELSLTVSARKRAQVTLIFKDKGIQILRVVGIGKREPPLFYLNSWPGIPNTMTVMLEVADSNDPPPTLQIVTPDGLNAVFTEWYQVKKRKRGQKMPAIWRGQVKFTVLYEDLPEDAFLLLSVPPDISIAVPVKPDPPDRGSVRGMQGD